MVALSIRHPLTQGHPPAWATEWGQDPHGPFLSFTIGNVSQRLRWIPPGQFLMGSPEDEKWRLSQEGPQHLVEMDQGFWLFNTPCSQALWQVVMGSNPSQFQGDGHRPVESVDWHDVQRFLQRINERVPGLELILPSEQQWEYACRAGTSMATYGPLAEIAWYKGNSQSRPQAIASKAANAWGLYDMLGNVWEWCADVYQPYGGDLEAETNRSATEDALRVVRGGSWRHSARAVRAAYRDGSLPQNRNRNISFRCARGQGEERSGLGR